MRVPMYLILHHLLLTLLCCSMLVTSNDDNNCIPVTSSLHKNRLIRCFTSRNSSTSLPDCLTLPPTTRPSTTQQNVDKEIVAEYTRQSLESFLRIGNSRRREFLQYISRQTNQQDQNRPLIKVVLDGSCSNKVEIKDHHWIIVGRNILNPALKEHIKYIQHLNVLVIYKSYFDEFSLKTKKQMITRIGQVIGGNHNDHRRLGGHGKVIIIDMEAQTNIINYNNDIADNIDSNSKTNTISDQLTLRLFQHHSMYTDARFLTLENIQTEVAALYFGFFSNDSHNDEHQHEKVIPKLKIICATVRNKFIESSINKTEYKRVKKSVMEELFFPPVEKMTEQNRDASTTPLHGISKTVVINLDHRRDRWEKMSLILSTKLHLQENFDYERRSAFNGRTIGTGTISARLSPDLLHLFRTDRDIIPPINPYLDHGFRQGVLGCSISHLMIWRDMMNDDSLESDDAWLILEDDMVLKKGKVDGSLLSTFNIALLSLWGDASWKWVYLSSLDNEINTLSGIYEVHPGISQYRKTLNDLSYGGGTAGYIMRKKGAIELLDKARQNGIAQAIDWFMLEVGIGSMSMNKHAKDSENSKDSKDSKDLKEEIDEGAQNIYVMSPYLFDSPKSLGIKGAISDTNAMYPFDKSILKAQRKVEQKMVNQNCGKDRISNYHVNIDNLKSNHFDWFRINIGTNGHAVQLQSSSYSSTPVIWVVPRPSFDMIVELEMLQGCPITVNELVHGKYQCSRVCVEVIYNHDKSQNIDKTTTNIWCRPVGLAGWPMHISTPLLGTVKVKTWIIDVKNRLLSKIKTHTFQVRDVATIKLTRKGENNYSKNDLDSINISLYAPIDKWAFRPELYAMCGELETKNQEDMIISLGCQNNASSTRIFSSFYSSGTKINGRVRMYLMGIDGTKFGYSKWMEIFNP